MERTDVRIDELLNDPTVVSTIGKLQVEWKRSGKRVSDIVIENGPNELAYQYVDLVMEGGGVLGIALIGYCHCLEQMGIRFLSIGGTSAGAINALLMCGLAGPAEQKARRVAEELANLDLSSFVDGGKRAASLIESIRKRRHWTRISLDVARNFFPLLGNLGLNPGDRFDQWLTNVLIRYNVETRDKLHVRMQLPEEVQSIYDPDQTKTIDDRLAIISAELSTQSKIRFPRMAELFWDPVGGCSPAHWVRASMSVPYFFEPYTVAALNQNGKDWVGLTGYNGQPPKLAVFWDGGILSNFPIYVFHARNRVPRAPTFGVKLGISRDVPSRVSNLLSLSGSALKALRKVLDYDFISNNPDYKKLIASIDTKDHRWLDFNLTAASKIDLFKSGVLCAATFLTKFHWENYKTLRKAILQSQRGES